MEQSWRDLSVIFRRSAAEFPKFRAQWNSSTGNWTLDLPSESRSSETANADAARVFKETASVAALRLPLTANKPLWQAWLDVMRVQKRGFERDFRYRSGAWDAFVRSRENPSYVPDPREIWYLPTGEIKSVFEASAEFCEELALTSATLPQPTVASESDNRAQANPGEALDPVDLLQLSPGIDSPDPVEGNPFPKHDVRHGFWDRATREAEEEMCRLNEAFVRGRAHALEDRLPFDLGYMTTRYDIWARRGVRVILTREMIAAWDQWLANFANETLKTFNSFSPPDVALQKLREALIGRREHWKAEGRRCVSLQQERHAQNRNNFTSLGGSLPRQAPEDQSARTVVGQHDTRATCEPPSRRAEIDAFISKLASRGRKVTRKDIWSTAGYADATEFERFQRNDPRTTDSAAAAFKRILSMNPDPFLESLDKKSPPK